MKQWGFVGPTYQNRSRKASADRCVNLYPELVPTGGKNNMVLHGTPGLSVFAILNDGPVRALYRSDENGERVLAIGRDTLYNLDSAGVLTILGTVSYASTAPPAMIAYNGVHYMIVSNDVGYILDGNTLTQIADADFPGARQVVFLDGYFITFQNATQRIRISALNDGTNWTATDFQDAQASPDVIVGILAHQEELWIFGSEKTEVWYNSGNLDFPLERVQGAVIEQGSDAAFSPAKSGNRLFWLGGDVRGRGVVWGANGYIPERVSTHAVEFAIQSYTVTSDAVGYAYQEDGHEFYVLTFPSAGASWVYDVTTGLWHERGYWDPAEGDYRAQRAVNHVRAFGRNLVGDRTNGNIYTQDLDIYDDAGDAIRRLRRSPHISNENQWLLHRSFQIDMEVGVGIATGQGATPQLMFRYSNDGGFNWSQRVEASIGAMGERRTRVKFNRLGRSRDRVYEIAISDPVKVAIVDAYVEVDGGMERT